MEIKGWRKPPVIPGNVNFSRINKVIFIKLQGIKVVTAKYG